MAETAKWYVVHTYSGYENKVAQNLEKTVQNRKLHDLIVDIKVPTETVIEIKDNKKREVERKIFPSYVLVKMVLTDDSWYVVRNTRGVTGFVGPTSKPIPLTEEEVAKLGVETRQVEVDYAEGDNVKIAKQPCKRDRFDVWPGNPGGARIGPGTVGYTVKIISFALIINAFYRGVTDRVSLSPVGGAKNNRLLRHLPQYSGGANNGSKGSGLH